MRTYILLLVAASAILMICEEANAECSLEQDYRCFSECKAKGHHSMCQYERCECDSCYYRACKVKCAKEGKIGQCNGVCQCLG